MKLRAFCSLRAVLGLEATGVSTECRSHFSPPWPYVVRSVGVPDFSGPKVSPHLTASGLPGGFTWREGMRERHAELARAQPCFCNTLLPPTPTPFFLGAEGRQAGSRTHTSGVGLDSGVPPGLGQGGV